MPSASAPPGPANLLDHVFGVLLPGRRQESLDALTHAGFIGTSSVPLWTAELARKDLVSPFYDWQLNRFKLALDQTILDEQIGPLSSRKTQGIVRNAMQCLALAGETTRLSLAQIVGKKIIDFGSGVYCPLAVGMVLYANGFAQVVGCEPFSLDEALAYGSVFETIRNAFADPSSFNFSGIANEQMLKRLAELDFSGLRDKLARFNADASDEISLGPVRLVRSTQHPACADFDLMISNSVLEHVSDLGTELQTHRRLMRPGALCVHTVDFSDHRANGTGLDPFGMYYDDVFAHAINGLRSSDLLTLFPQSGLRVLASKISTAAPEYIAFDRLTERFRAYTPEQLCGFVGRFVLTAD